MIGLPPPRARLYWACQLSGFGLYVAFTFFQATKMGMPTPRAWLEPLAAAGIGIATTHLLRRRIRVKRWLTLGAGALAPRVLLASMGLSMFLVACLGVVELGIYRDPQTSPVAMLLFATIRWTLVFLVWTSLYVGLGLVRHRQQVELTLLRLERAQEASELRALKAQLNPHFLFNSLNSIRALVTEEPARAQDAITELSRMLRYTLRSGEEDVVTLERELRTIDDYLALESLRLGGRLVVERNISDDARQACLPAMLLLTLVENAIKHGIAQLPAGGTLELRAVMEERTLCLEIGQPRPPERSVPLSKAESAGIGLPNAAERLRLLFGDGAHVALDLSVAGRARAHARIPSRE